MLLPNEIERFNVTVLNKNDTRTNLNLILDDDYNDPYIFLDVSKTPLLCTIKTFHKFQIFDPILTLKSVYVSRFLYLNLLFHSFSLNIKKKNGHKIKNILEHTQIL